MNAAGFSFTKAKNSIAPYPGQCLKMYTYDKRLGAGTKPFLVIGCSSRYITLYYIPALLPIKVRQKHWPHVVITETECHQEALRTELVKAVEWHQRRARAFDTRAADAAMFVINNLLPSENDNAPDTDSTSGAPSIIPDR